MNDSHFTPPSAASVPEHRELHRSRSGFSRLVEYTVDGGRPLVIKTIRPDYHDQAAAMAMLRREYQLTSSLYHNGVVQIFEWQDIDGIGAGIVMQRVDGVTLTSLLATANLTHTQRTHILNNILDAVGYIHSRGIVHRDLKPDNIMVNPATGHTTIIDFGLAARIGSGTLPGGTPPYSAPEQMDTPGTAHPTADIHAIGHLMTDLFGNGRQMSRVAQRCTHHTPAARPQTIDEVRRLIAATRRRKILIPVIAGLLLIAAIIATYSALVGMPPGASAPVASTEKPNTAQADLSDLSAPAPPIETPATTPPPAAAPIETPATTPTPTAEKPAEKSATTPAPAPTADNIENRVRTYATQCAEKYFAMHIQALDTARQRSTIMMGWSENWIFGAERAYNQWLEKEIGIDHPDYGILRQTGINAIKDYRMRHAGEHKKALDAALTRI